MLQQCVLYLVKSITTALIATAKYVGSKMVADIVQVPLQVLKTGAIIIWGPDQVRNLRDDVFQIQCQWDNCSGCYQSSSDLAAVEVGGRT